MKWGGIGLLTGFFLQGCANSPEHLFEIVQNDPLVVDQGISRGAAWGDFDGDGYPDIFVTRANYDGSEPLNALYRNDAGRGFVRMPGSFGPSQSWEGAVWVDIDQDGDLDLHIVGRNGAGSMIFENLGGGTLEQRRIELLDDRVQSASMACWSDIDGDGLLDVFTLGYGAGRNRLFRGRGGWDFEEMPLPEGAEGRGLGRSCAWGDIDGDQLPELVIGNARIPNMLLRNLGAMRLQIDTNSLLQQDTGYTYGLSWTDVNGDGLRDLFVANFDGENTLYHGVAGGDLDPMPIRDVLQSTATKGHAWGDFDLDGNVDAYLGSGTPAPNMLNHLYLSSGDGGYSLVESGEFTSHADTSAAVALADYDLDGDLDIFVANWGGPNSVNRLYRNTTTRRGWLRVELEGVRSNRMGIGARVSVLTSRDGDVRRWQHRWLDMTTGYAGQNEPALHFGLRDADRVDSLVVAWPSGAVDRLGNVSAGETVRVREGMHSGQV